MAELLLEQKKAVLEVLLPMITDHKRNLFQKVLHDRTRHLTVVVEDIYQSQNASAVLRSADCFGVQDVHIIENRNEFLLNPDVALGSSKWLNIIKHNSEVNNTAVAYEHLRSQGYQIVATTPHSDDIMLEELDITQKTALIFGNELDGLTSYAKEHADVHMKIPMFGFTESFNISVSAAICLHYLTDKIRKSQAQWHLSENEQLDVLYKWTKSVVKYSEQLEKQMFGSL